MSKSQITDKLWVGSWKDAKEMLNHNDWGVVTTANDARVIGHEFYPITDPGTDSNDPIRIKRAIQTTLAFLEKYDNVLVHCQSGVNRSVSVVIGVLMIKQGMELSEAYTYVFKRRKLIHPQKTLLTMVCDTAGKEFPQDFERDVLKLDDVEIAVNKMYKRVLKRAADPGGLESYSQQVKMGRMTMAQLEYHLLNSEEYAKKFK